MADMVVAQSDDKLFLDKVIEFGISHEILTQERRQELARESADLSLSICQKFGLNAINIQDVLIAARIVYQLTSIGLEHASQDGNTLAAAHLLTTATVDALVGAVQELLDKSYRHLWAAVKRGCYTPYLNFYKYGNLIGIISDMITLQQAPYCEDKLSWSSMNFDSEADRIENVQGLHRALCEEQRKIALSLHTSSDLDRWLSKADTIAREMISLGTQKRKRRQ